MRSALAASAARLARALARRLGHGGSALPGLVAHALASDLLYDLAAGLPRGCVLISGTNGKTTTTSLSASVVGRCGFEPISNPSGSNLARGVLAHLLEHANWAGRPRWGQSAIGVFELDEAQLIASLVRLRPRVLALTNLFRDQLDRYGELDSLSAGIAASLGQCTTAPVLVVNVDDPALCHIASGHHGKVIGFGLEPPRDGRQPDEWADSTLCPRCGGGLGYDGVVFSHLGRWSCPACGFARPEPHVRARIDQADDDLVDLKVSLGEETVTLGSQLRGTYNAYNLLCALAVASALSLAPAAAARALSQSAPSFGRSERIALGDREVTLMLMKNPTGANELARMLADRREDFLILLNDQAADGEDVSWIWDVNFSVLDPKRLFVGGRRAADMALRLKYAGLQIDLAVEGPVAKSLDAAFDAGGDRLLILATYTAMLQIRRELVKRGAAREYWQATR